MNDTERKDIEMGRDHYKLKIDLLKHITSLSTGIILIIVAMIYKVFDDNLKFDFIVVVSIISFFASVVSALYLYVFYVSLHGGRTDYTKPAPKKILTRENRLFKVSFSCFLLGLFLFVVFYLVNSLLTV